MSRPYNLMPETLIATVRYLFRAGKRKSQDLNQWLDQVLVSSCTPINPYLQVCVTLSHQRGTWWCLAGDSKTKSVDSWSVERCQLVKPKLFSTSTSNLTYLLIELTSGLIHKSMTD